VPVPALLFVPVLPMLSDFEAVPLVEAPLLEWWLLFLALPITSILSARLEAGSKLARICVPSRMAEMPAATGWPRRSTWVCESTVSVTPPASWSSVMLFWSTFSTAPVTVRRLALSLDAEAELLSEVEPEELPIPEELPMPEELPVLPELPLWPYVEPEEPVFPVCP
jgi:hypothetical protein